ncbi:MAG: FAD-dependent oxidoreductase [Actinobacteria bacterium]|nr:FAD-dependent oxidoreductase [Actinomycetota bacterium]
MVTINKDAELNFDFAIIGGGPAGMAAAIQAAKHGVKIALLDERVTLGGQIYKQLGRGFKIANQTQLQVPPKIGQNLIADFDKQNISLFLKSAVISIEEDHLLFATEDEQVSRLKFKKLLIATGAYDRPVAFPGWTLPGVITAGAAQTLVKTQRVLPGSRILFAGSGPVALAFPAQLAGYGANIVSVLEAGSAPTPLNVLGLLVASTGNWDLISDAMKYRLALLRKRIPVKYRTIIVQAHGIERVEAVTIAKVDRNWRVKKGTSKRIEVDTLCLGYGFLPSNELLKLVGCDFEYQESKGGYVAQTDEWGRTSVPNVYAVGDGAGVEGSYIAISRGNLVGISVAQELGLLNLSQAREKAEQFHTETKERRRFQSALRSMFDVKQGIFELASDETIICRCEILTKLDIDRVMDSTADLSVVKAYTRAGMGPCKGRNCQRQISAMVAQRHGIDIADVHQGTPRFPVKPVALGAIADETVSDQKYFFDGK